MIRFNRRMFLRSASLGFLGVGWPGSAQAGTFFWKRLFSVPPRDTNLITPNEKFYIVSYSGFPDIELSNWSLYIGGQVKKPFRLSYADFYGRPAVEMAATLICIDTLPGGDTVSNAVWKGIPLRTLLEEVSPEPEAVDVVFRGADGYSDSIPFQRAMNGDVLLAYIMNGAALPREHGYPIRAVVPGLYGIKNVKWINEIEVVNYDYKGYWQQRGWTDLGEIRTISRIDDPGHYQEIKGVEYTVRGLAFGGYHGIARVEVSTDGGSSWNPALLDPPLSPYTWVIWNYPWKIPSPGAYTMVVRAWNRRGELQSGRLDPAYPAGASGYHTIVALVS